MDLDEKSLLKGKRILVTGGSGVIGRELLTILMQVDAAQVMTIDREPLPEGSWDGVIEVRKDIVDDDLKELLEFEPEVIFHLAAAFERSKETPEFWEVNWHDNVCVNNRIVNLVSQVPGVQTFVFASSYLVYSEEQYFYAKAPEATGLLKEGDYKNPRNLCGAAKFYTESEMDFINELLSPSTRMVAARIFRVYGRGSNDVVSRWVRSALVGEAVDLYNKDNRFDYIYAGDVAEGLVRMAASESVSGAVNLGSGQARRVEELLTAIREQIPDSPMEVRDLGGIEEYEASCADVTRLRELTGWQPPTSLEEGVDIIINWETRD